MKGKAVFKRIMTLGIALFLSVSCMNPSCAFAEEVYEEDGEDTHVVECEENDPEEERAVSADEPQEVSPDAPVIPDKATACGSCGEDIQWAYYEEEGLLLLSGSGSMTSLSSKSQQPWSDYREEIITVQIRETKTGSLPDSISAYAFTGSVNLQKLFFVTERSDFSISIGTSAFENCTSLQSFFRADSADTEDISSAEDISLKNVNLLGNKAFFTCRVLQGLCFGSSLTQISTQTFSDCVGLQEVEIPSNVQEIGSSAFAGCKSLKNVSFSERLDELKLGTGVFYQCVSLESIMLPYGITEIPGGAFRECRALKELSIPASCKSIGRFAFTDCASLEKLSIPYGVEKIQDYAFYACVKLTEVIIPVSVVRGAIGTDVFYKTDRLMIYAYRNSGGHRYAMQNELPYTVLTPIQKDYIYTARNGNQYRILDDESCALWKYAGDHRNIRIEEEIVFDTREDIEVGAAPQAATGDASLSLAEEETDLASDVTLDGDFLVTFQTSHITRRAFDSYRNTQQELPTYTLEIGDSVLSMDEGTFENFVYVTDVISLGGIGEISANAFRNCYSLQRVNAGVRVTAIGSAAFGGCRALSSMRFPENETLPPCASAFTGVHVSSLTLSGKEGIALSIPQRLSSTIVLSSKSAVYTGKAISIGKAIVTGSNAGVSYYYYTDAACTTKTTSKNGASKTGAAPAYVGKYYVKAKVGQTDQYSAKTSKAAVLTIKPKATEILSVSGGSASFSVRWGKRTVQTTGYQIQYSTSSSFASPVTLSVRSNSTLSRSVTGLKRNTKYYVRVRTYRKCGSFNLYSGWCTKKAILTK